MFVKYFTILLIGSLLFLQSAVAYEVIDSFPSPGNEPRGLAWDGQWLWCADAATNLVYKLDPTNGTVISSFMFFIGASYGGLTWGEDNTIWIANGSLIHQINPADGREISSFSCPGG